jgi:hypothetical protein
MPDGQWIDFHSDITYEGGKVNVVPSPIESMPILVKAGAIIPLSPDFQTIKDYSTEHLIVHHYPSNDVETSEFTMYHDDGKSANSLQEEKYEMIRFASNYQGQDINFLLESEESNFNGPVSRMMELVFHRCSAPISVQRDEIDILKAGSPAEYESEEEAWYANEPEDLLFIKFNWNGDPTNIRAGEIEIIENHSTIQEHQDIGEVSIWPNPAQDFINLEYTTTRQLSVNIRVLDMKGNVLLKQNIAEDGMGAVLKEIQLPGLKPGIYLLAIDDGKGIMYRKIIII